MYDYAYKTSVGGFYTFKLVAFIIAIAATIIIYTVFMDKRNKDTYSNPLKKLFDYLHFNKFFIFVNGTFISQTKFSFLRIF